MENLPQSINVKQILSIFSMGEHGCSHRFIQVMMTPQLLEFLGLLGVVTHLYAPGEFRPP